MYLGTTLKLLHLTEDVAGQRLKGEMETQGPEVIDIDMTLTLESLSHVQLFVTPWTVAYQVPPSMEFSRQEYWSGLPLPSPGNLPNPGIEPGYPALQADALLSEPRGKPQNQLAEESTLPLDFQL